MTQSTGRVSFSWIDCNEIPPVLVALTYAKSSPGLVLLTDTRLASPGRFALYPPRFTKTLNRIMAIRIMVPRSRRRFIILIILGLLSGQTQLQYWHLWNP